MEKTLNITDLLNLVGKQYADGVNGCLSFSFMRNGESGAFNIIITDDDTEDVLGNATMFQITLYRYNIDCVGADIRQTLAHELGHWAGMAIEGETLDNEWMEELAAHYVGRSLYSEADWSNHISLQQDSLSPEEDEESKIEADKRINILSNLTFMPVFG